MTFEDKERFLREVLIPAIAALETAATPAFGKMGVQQMTEHLSDYVRMANGRDLTDCDASIEHLDRMREWLMSDKPFRDNTPNKLMPDVPLPVRYSTMHEALDELQLELDAFFDVYQQDKQKRITNPFFGDLDYEEQVQLLWKHGQHHLRQFGHAAIG